MAGSLNRVQLLGNVGRDPEIRSTSGGTRVASFSIATSESWTDKNSGEKRERTEWTNIVVWNEGLIGVIEKYVSKGSKIFVEGKLQTRKWQDQQGTDRYSTEVVLQGFSGQIILLGQPKGGGSSRGDAYEGDTGGGGGGGYANTGTGNRSGGSAPAGRSLAEDLSDEIPFISSDLDREPYLARKRWSIL